MTHVVKLFGDSIVAEQTEKGTYIVRKGENLVSPYEYEDVRQLTPKCWVLRRAGTKTHDLVFANGRVEYGFGFVYLLAKRRGRKKRQMIGIQFPNGTAVIDDSGNFWGFVPELHPIVVVQDRFFVVLPDNSSDGYVRVYSPYGDFLAEGLPNEALKEACEKVRCIYGWHDVCNVSW